MVFYLQTLRQIINIIGLLTRGKTPKRAIKSPSKPKKIKPMETIENEVVYFINKQMLKDKKEYRGHISTKYNKGSEWSDFSWLVDEILMFLNKEFLTSYILRQFSNKYDYTTLDEIIRNNFKQEYEYALKNFEVDK